MTNTRHEVASSAPSQARKVIPSGSTTEPPPPSCRRALTILGRTLATAPRHDEGQPPCIRFEAVPSTAKPNLQAASENRALRRNSGGPAFYAAFLKTTNSV